MRVVLKRNAVGDRRFDKVNSVCQSNALCNNLQAQDIGRHQKTQEAKYRNKDDRNGKSARTVRKATFTHSFALNEDENYGIALD